MNICSECCSDAKISKDKGALSNIQKLFDASLRYKFRCSLLIQPTFPDIFYEIHRNDLPSDCNCSLGMSIQTVFYQCALQGSFLFLSGVTGNQMEYKGFVLIAGTVLRRS